VSIEQLRRKAHERLGALPRDVELRTLEDLQAHVGEVNTSKTRLRQFYVERGAALLELVVVRPDGRRKGSGRKFPGATEDQSLLAFWTRREKARRNLIMAAVERGDEKGLREPTDKEIAYKMRLWNSKGKASNTYNTYLRDCRERGIGKPSK
jgi:GNAT superfamily N-acetyltransferase